jgi:hypothetical protein
VVGSGSYPEYTVVVPKGWFELAGNFIITGPTEPVLGFGVWDVGEVYRDPCHWQGQGFDPGPGIETSLPRSSPRRRATPPRRPT